MDAIHAMKVPAKVAGILALVGFAIKLSTTTVENGVCSYRDYGALVIGAAAILAGLLGLVAGAKEKDTTTLLVSGIAILVGVVHVLRGLGTVGGPC